MSIDKQRQELIKSILEDDKSAAEEEETCMFTFHYFRGCQFNSNNVIKEVRTWMTLKITWAKWLQLN